MSKENRPAFLLYASDWTTGTADMSLEEQGIYMKLLCQQWLKGGLPNDIGRICKLVFGPESDSESLANRKRIEYVLQKFRLKIVDGKEMLVNDRLEAIREAERTKFENRSEANSRNARKKRKKRGSEPELKLANGERIANESHAKIQRKEDEYEYEKEDENRNEIRGVQGGNFDGVNIEEEVAQFIETFGVGQKRHQTERAYVNTVRHLTNPSGGMGYRARDACLMLRNKAASYRAFCLAVKQIQQHPPKWLSEEGYLTDWNQELVNQREIQKGKNENGHGREKPESLATKAARFTRSHDI